MKKMILEGSVEWLLDIFIARFVRNILQKMYVRIFAEWSVIFC